MHSCPRLHPPSARTTLLPPVTVSTVSRCAQCWELQYTSENTDKPGSETMLCRWTILLAPSFSLTRSEELPRSRVSWDYKDMWEFSAPEFTSRWMKDADDAGKGLFWQCLSSETVQWAEGHCWAVCDAVSSTLWVSYIKKQRCLHEARLVSNKLTLLYIKTQVRIKQLKEIRLWQRICHVKWVVQRPFLMSDCFRSLGGRGTRSFKACDPVSGASVSKSGC